MLESTYSILPRKYQAWVRKTYHIYRYCFLDEQPIHPTRISSRPNELPAKRMFYKLFPGADYRKLKEDLNSSNFPRITNEYESFLFPSAISREIATLVYAIIRSISPETVIETGVANGVSSLVILQALEDNERGELISIDYPNRSNVPLEEIMKNEYKQQDLRRGAIPSDQDPGWIVPTDLNERWQLNLGKVQDKLPSVVSQKDNVDLFHFDSEHTTSAMLFEYEIAWPKLTDDGLILTDDVLSSDAFHIFRDERDVSAGIAESGSTGYGYLSPPRD